MIIVGDSKTLQLDENYSKLIKYCKENNSFVTHSSRISVLQRTTTSSDLAPAPIEATYSLSGTDFPSLRKGKCDEGASNVQHTNVQPSGVWGNKSAAQPTPAVPSSRKSGRNKRPARPQNSSAQDCRAS